MKKSLSLLLGAVVPSLFLVLGACGDDVVDAELGDDDPDTDASRQDATPVPRRDAGDADARETSADTGTRDGDTDSSDGDGGDSDADAGRLFQPGEFVTRLAQAYCANYDGCCQADDIYAPAAGTPTCGDSIADPNFFRTDGRTFFNGLLDSYYYNVNVAASTRVVVDDVKGQSCLDKVAALGCIRNLNEVPAADWKSLLQDCALALHGDGVANSDCYSDAECATSFTCQGAGTGAADPPGKCMAFQEAGDPWIQTGQSYGDSCSYKGFAAVTELHNGYTATGDTCQPQRALGSACRPGDPDPFTGDDFNCATGACSLNDPDENAATGYSCTAFKWDPYACSTFALP